MRDMRTRTRKNANYFKVDYLGPESSKWHSDARNGFSISNVLTLLIQYSIRRVWNCCRINAKEGRKVILLALTPSLGSVLHFIIQQTCWPYTKQFMAYKIANKNCTWVAEHVDPVFDDRDEPSRTGQARLKLETQKPDKSKMLVVLASGLFGLFYDVIFWSLFNNRDISHWYGLELLHR